MSKDRGERLQDAHNQGEQDQRENNHNPPNSILQETFSSISDGEKRAEENVAYEKGWDNAKKQG